MELLTKQPTIPGPAALHRPRPLRRHRPRRRQSRLRVNTMRFSPRARTAWHIHSLGQSLHVTGGRRRRHPRQVIIMRPGDTVQTPPDEQHLHGALPEHFMTTWPCGKAATPHLGRPRHGR